MMADRRRPLRTLLVAHRDKWDRDETRSSVREEFQKVTICGTDALGAEVFASGTEERVVPHTCKSRACPSCGYQATRAWQRDQWTDLPEVPYAHLCLTMPDVLWPLFRQNRHLLHDLPVRGAEVIQQWARRKYGVRLIIVIVPHTFGGHLNFNCHLHILVSEGGLRDDGTGWADRCGLDRKALMPMWRFAVLSLLRQAADAGVLCVTTGRDELDQLLAAQSERLWITHIKRFSGKRQFLAYAGRYARRPPVALHRFRKVGRQEIRYMTKDTRTKTRVETVFTPEGFLSALADHVPDRYRHGVRYFGLLAPRTKSQKHDSLFAFLGQTRRSKPARLRWASSRLKSFGVDPLIGRDGHRMAWTRRLPPTTPVPRLPGL